MPYSSLGWRPTSQRQFWMHPFKIFNINGFYGNVKKNQKFI